MIILMTLYTSTKFPESLQLFESFGMSTNSILNILKFRISIKMKAELQFFFSDINFMMLYISTKFHENTFYGFKIIK